MSIRLGQPRRFGQIVWRPGALAGRWRPSGGRATGAWRNKAVIVGAAILEAHVLQPTDSARQFLPFPRPPTPLCLRAFTKTEGETAAVASPLSRCGSRASAPPVSTSTGIELPQS